MCYFFRKIHNGLLHFKGLLLTGKVTAPRLKTIKINGNVQLLKESFTFNNPFVLNSLNVANRYIFNSQSDIKVKKGRRIPGFLDEFVPYW